MPDWIREGKEFRLNDQLFDIVKTIKISGGIIYRCINDKEEARLFKNLDKIVREEMAKDGSVAGKSAKLIAKILLQNYITEEPFNLPKPESWNQNLIPLQAEYKSFIFTTLKPPPRNL